MIYCKSILAGLLFFLLTTIPLAAQQTGSFSLTIDFNEPDYDFNRTLYFYVPLDYNENVSYSLVAGFRGGPHSNAGEFRDQLSFLADSINAIVLCPENEDHFWNEEGLTKQLFNYSLDTAMSMYNIDSEMIYLTGLSYGGRHSVIVSMDTDDGPIPNLRGVIPFAAGSESNLQPNYEDILDFPPACICIGLNDSGNFIDVSNNLHDDITLNGGASFLNEIPGVGHTVDFPTFPQEIMECIDFIESTYNPNSIDELISESVRLFPNPASDLLYIHFNNSFEPNSFVINDLNGQLIQESKMIESPVDISNLKSGVYQISLFTNDHFITKPFLILK